MNRPRLYKPTVFALYLLSSLRGIGALNSMLSCIVGNQLASSPSLSCFGSNWGKFLNVSARKGIIDSLSPPSSRDISTQEPHSSPGRSFSVDRCSEVLLFRIDNTSSSIILVYFKNFAGRDEIDSGASRGWVRRGVTRALGAGGRSVTVLACRVGSFESAEERFPKMKCAMTLTLSPWTSSAAKFVNPFPAFTVRTVTSNVAGIFSFTFANAAVDRKKCADICIGSGCTTRTRSWWWMHASRMRPSTYPLYVAVQ